MNILTDVTARPVIAHRGGRAGAPENTIETMRRGLADGADAIELDVRLSADGVVVVIHDPTVDRTTDGSGVVAQMALAELKSLDAGARFGPQRRATGQHGRQRIPTLAEVLEEFPHVALLIEVKELQAAVPTRTLIEARLAEGRCVVDSLSSRLLDPFRGSRIPRGAGRSGAIRLLAESFLGGPSPIAADIAALCIPPDYHRVPLPVGRLIAAMRAAHKPTHIWTVNEPADALRLWRLGARGIITDDVPAIVAARSRYSETLPPASP